MMTKEERARRIACLQEDLRILKIEVMRFTQAVRDLTTALSGGHEDR